MVRQHRLKLTGRTGQDENRLPLVLEAFSWSDAGWIEQDIRTLHDHRLAFALQGRFATERPVPFHHRGVGTRIDDAATAQDIRDGIASDVVGGRPQPTAHKHQVDPRQRAPHSVGNVFEFVPDRCIAVHMESDRANLLTQRCGMAVNGTATQQLAAR